MDCKDQILSLVWKPRTIPQVNQTTKSSRSVTNSIDKNKFVIFTSKGKVQEFTFAEKSFSVLGLSCKGEICMSMQNPSNLNSSQSINSLVQNTSEKKCHSLQTLQLYPGLSTDKNQPLKDAVSEPCPVDKRWSIVEKLNQLSLHHL